MPSNDADTIDRSKFDRKTRDYEYERPFACTHDDCRRVIWSAWTNTDPEEYPERVEIEGCLECTRPTVYEQIDVPDDTIMLDSDGNAIPKSREAEISNSLQKSLECGLE